MGHSGSGSHSGGGDFGGGGGSYDGGYSSYDYSSSTTTNHNSSMSCVIIWNVFFLLLLLLMLGGFITIFVMSEENTNSMFSNPVISPGEQVLWCSQKRVTLDYSSENIRVYESKKGTPALGSEVRNLSVKMSGVLADKSYAYRGLYLTPRSQVTVRKETNSPYANLIVIKGATEMKKFMGRKRYNSLYESPGSINNYIIHATEYDEYFVIVEPDDWTSYFVVMQETIATFDVKNLAEQCTSHSHSGPCSLNEDTNPDYCIVIDYNVTQNFNNVKVTISGDKNSGLGMYSIIAIAAGCLVFVAIVVYVGFQISKKYKETKSANTETKDMKTPLTSQQFTSV